MRAFQYTVTAVLFLILCQVSQPLYSQLGIPIDIKKPAEYDDRVLRSEKSDQGKFGLPKRFIQNTVTHYNYYFNANNKLRDVLEKAKSAFTDDYTQLLPFYNYTLDATAADSIQLDSIVHKTSTGIALHDLRNDWVDNLYLLWGASYYLQKKFDSAYLMFQFINYAFAPKEKDGYYIAIGSKMDGNSASSIATKEKKGPIRKIFSQPPSRNESFIWQIRNFLAQDKLAEAASLIVVLRDDPLFPKRLLSDLHELQALWFYKQNSWDSAAIHLVEALGNATNLQEKARWEYLAAQLFEKAGHYKEAERLYVKVSGHTTDPILDIYARLYAIRANKDGGDKNIERNVDELLRMARRDKYTDYQDIIYYMAAQMQLEGNNPEEAMKLLLKSTSFASNNPAQRNKAFLQLAELAYERKEYRNSHNFYDSIRLEDPSLKDPEAIKARKKTLGDLALQMDIAERKDSLQRIAALPEDERKDFVKKLVKEIRKKQGLKEEPLTTSGNPLASANPPLFPPAQSKGEWYFYNAASKSRGLGEFKSRWGNRPNIDNWRRSAVLSALIQNKTQTPDNAGNQNSGKTGSGEVNYDDLYAQLPLSAEQQEKSNDSLQQALFAMGKIFSQEIEDCKAGTEILENLRQRFPRFKPMDEVLFHLYYCYSKNGESAKAAAIKKLMADGFAGSEFTTIVTTGKNPKSPDNPDATNAYEKIYDLFITGKFEEAVAQKKAADSKYGKNYWTPQLLYIEAVYYIRQRQDSTAIGILTNIVSQFPQSPLAKKASNLISVLARRSQIESELTRLQVTRNDQPVQIPVNNPVTNPVVNPGKDSSATQPVANNNPPPVNNPNTNVPPPDPAKPFSLTPASPCYVVLVFNQIDIVYCREAMTAFTRYHMGAYPSKQMQQSLVEFDNSNRLLLLSPFKDAAEGLSYIDNTKPKLAMDILSWLRRGMYYFLLVNDADLEKLKASKDLNGYKTFLNGLFPGKF